MMNRTEFMEAIYNETGFMPGHKRRQVMSHFANLFATCDDDYELISSLGTPENALRKYLNSTKITSKIPRPLFIAAILLLSPFIAEAALISLLLIAIIITFATIVLIVIPLSGISLWLNGIDVIVKSIPQPVILADKLWQIGIGLMYFAAGILILLIVYKLYSKLIPWILGRISALYTRIEKRRTK